MRKRFFFHAFGSFPFPECVPRPSVFDIDILQHSLSDLKFSRFKDLKIGNRWYFQLVEKKKCFAWENAKKVIEGLGTGWFITVTNLAPSSSDSAKTLTGNVSLIMQGFNNFAKSLSNFFHNFWDNCFSKPKLLLDANMLIYLNKSANRDIKNSWPLVLPGSILFYIE